MNDLFLDKSMMATLLAPWKWKIISSLFPPDHPSVTNQQHQDWSKQHRDHHPHREVLIGLKGSCLYSFKQKIYPCAPGTVFLFNSFEEHDNYYAPASHGTCHLWLNFVQDNIFVRLFNVQHGRIATARSKTFRLNNSDLESVLRHCWSELEKNDGQPDEFRRMKIIAALLGVVLYIIELDSQGTESQTGPAAQKMMIETIKKHIQETSGKGLTLDNLARIAGYSKFHFLRVFKKYAGESVHNYINACRRKKVIELRRQGHIKKQIAEQLGFSCLAAFSRWYKDNQ